MQVVAAWGKGPKLSERAHVLHAEDPGSVLQVGKGLLLNPAKLLPINVDNSK